MKANFILLTVMLTAGLDSTYAQSVKSATNFEGTWKGTSLCQVKNSPCHDETVVYYISRKNGTDSFSIKANKIVNGVEEEMGILPFVYDSKSNELVSSAYGKWTLRIEKDKMKGTLIEKGKLFRIIELSKSN